MPPMRNMTAVLSTGSDDLKRSISATWSVLEARTATKNHGLASSDVSAPTVIGAEIAMSVKPTNWAVVFKLEERDSIEMTSPAIKAPAIKEMALTLNFRRIHLHSDPSNPPPLESLGERPIYSEPLGRHGYPIRRFEWSGLEDDLRTLLNVGQNFELTFSAR